MNKWFFFNKSSKSLSKNIKNFANITLKIYIIKFCFTSVELINCNVSNLKEVDVNLTSMIVYTLFIIVFGKFLSF